MSTIIGISHSLEGDIFLAGMAQSMRKDQLSQEMFSIFVHDSGFAVWHIHDGWVKHNHNSGADALLNDKIHLTWLFEHTGYSHSCFKPTIGDRMVIKKRSPCAEDDGVKFQMYCYEVSQGPRSWIESPSFNLKLIEVKWAVFNKNGNRYQLCPSRPAKKMVSLREWQDVFDWIIRIFR